MTADCTGTDRTDFEKYLKELQDKASHAELTEQRLRDARSQVDAQIERFTRIHKYAMDAFAAGSRKNLFVLVAEGAVDIFQVESGAVFSLNLFDNTLVLESECNLPRPTAKIELPPDWVREHELWVFQGHSAGFESPVVNPPWREMGLAHVVFMPLFDNERRLNGVVIGGISSEGERFYDFTPREILSSFMVYVQQMDAIGNTFDALDKARQHAEAKNRFLANLSHEIRTPMNAIIGMVQLAGQTDDLAEMRDYIHQIDLSSVHLLGLLNDVLDISKIEEGKLVLAEEEFNLRDSLTSLLNSVGAGARAKRQELTVEYHGLTLFDLRGDALKLAQVLLNLLSNSIKFTPEGGRIRLDIEELNRDERRAFLKFAVSDTGIGLSPDFLDRIFAPFEQADSGVSRKYGGTGLGLAISQHIVELMGGRIKAENLPGGGSRFSFFVWFEALARKTVSAPAVAQAAPAPILAGKTALIVDDIDINRSIAAAFLKRAGLKSEQAENGQMAVDMFRASPPDHYDLILMDMQMPVLGGIAATVALRALDRADARDVVILAMTANVFKEDVQAALDAGMNGYIAKPIKNEIFLDTIQKALTAKEERAASRAGREAPAPAG